MTLSAPPRLPLLVAALVVSACSGAGDIPARSPTPSSASIPPLTAPAPSPRESPLPGPSGVDGLPRCHTPELEVAFRSVSSGAGHGFADLEVRSRAAHRCYLYGFVALQMLDRAGNAIPTNLVRDGTPQVGGVILEPSSPALATNNPQGHAAVQLAWVQNCDITGTHFEPEVPETLALTPPDELDPLRVPARAEGGGVMSVCPGQEAAGTVHTQAVGPAAHE